MNKQELIDKLKKLLAMPSEIQGTELDFVHDYVIRRAITLVKQLDEQQAPINEPEKPVVPEYVADMIVEKKEQKNGIVETIKNLGVYNNPFNCIIEKQLKWITENQEDFAKAWLYGYEIEKDKLYTVELPNPNAGGHVVLCKTSDGIVSIAFAGMARWKGGKNFQLTESEIKEDFEWAWQFAEDVEG